MPGNGIGHYVPLETTQVVSVVVYKYLSQRSTTANWLVQRGAQRPELSNPKICNQSLRHTGCQDDTFFGHRVGVDM
jgi:hypothetical protein